MNWKLDFQEKEPIYLQIVEQVKSAISSGVLKPGDQLPTVREVAADLRINFNTAARGYRILHEDGTISTQQGRGTFVREQALQKPSRRTLHAQLTQLVKGWLEEARRLGIDPGDLDKEWREQISRW